MPSPRDVAAFRAFGLTKRYGETVAISGLDFACRPGTILGLVGENGAGKSTLLNVLSGITAPDEGRIEVHGQEVKLASYVEAQRLGIGRVFQEQALVLNVPVFENLLLGYERNFGVAGQFLARRRMVEAAAAMVEAAGASIDVRKRTGDLSFSKRQLVEVIRACLAPSFLAGATRSIILLDEPTASLEKADEAILLRMIERLSRDSALLFVSHRLNEVLSLCEDILVLKDGRQVTTVKSADADERALHRLMVGRERDADYYHERAQREVEAQPLAFEARSMTRGSQYAHVDLAVKSGEILGIGGLLKSGKAELGRGLAGIEPPERGEIRIGGGEWIRPGIQALVASGLGYVPAERLTEGMIASFPVSWNISLASGEDLFSTPLGIWRQAEERQASTGLVSRLGIKTPSVQTTCSTLSGGNQQKVVLARWLARGIKVLILDNPTRGVDAGAKEQIYRLLRGLAASGVAIILITDELLELIGLSNRIAIMRGGQVTSIVPASPEAKPSEQQLVELMMSDHAASPERAA